MVGGWGGGWLDVGSGGGGGLRGGTGRRPMHRLTHFLKGLLLHQVEGADRKDEEMVGGGGGGGAEEAGVGVEGGRVEGDGEMRAGGLRWGGGVLAVDPSTYRPSQMPVAPTSRRRGSRRRRDGGVCVGGGGGGERG